MCGLHRKLLCKEGISVNTEPQSSLCLSCSHEDQLHRGTVHLSTELSSLPCPSLLRWQPYHEQDLSDPRVVTRRVRKLPVDPADSLSSLRHR